MRVLGGGLLVLVASCLFLAPATAHAERVAKTPAFTGGTPRIKTGPPAGPPAATVRPSVKVADAGDRPTPHVAIDDAGTAYITWLLPTGAISGTEGGIGFCRLPRGAQACDNPAATRVLRPQKAAYGPGDDPAYNQDAGGGAYPLVLGDQLFILTTRDITTYATPAGDSTTTTIAFASTDGGTTFSAATPVATGIVIATRPVRFGPAENPLIGLMGPGSATIGGDGTARFASIQGGAFTADSIPFPSALTATLAPLPDGGIAVGYASAEGATVQRAGAARPTGEQSFGAPQRVPGGGRGLTGLGRNGSGLFATSLGNADPALNERPVVTPLDGGGGPVALAGDSTGEPVAATAAAAPGGQLVVGFKDVGDPVSANGLYIRRSGDGQSFTAPERLSGQADGVFGTDIAAAPDGGGVAVWQTEELGGEVRANVFGPQDRLTAPGLPGTTPGSGSASVDDGIVHECERIAVGGVQVTTAGGVGCFLPGVGANKHKSVSNGAVLYNGLRITPDNGTQIVIDVDRPAKTVTMYSTGSAVVDIPGNEAGDITIFKGKLKQKLTAKVGQPILDLPKYPAKIRGLAVANALAPLATNGFGSRIPVELDLGPQFLGLTGHAELVLTHTGGLQLDTLRIRQGTLPLGPVTVDGLDVSWTREGNRWEGSAGVTLASGAKVKVQASFDGASFSATASYDVPFPGIELFATPPVFLHQISAGLDVNRDHRPLRINGGVKIGAVPITPGVYLLDVTGTVGLAFGNPFVVEVRGDLEILSMLNVASARLRAGSDGIVTADFEVGLLDKDWAYVGANVHAGVSTAGFEGKGSGELCIGIKLVSYCRSLPEGYVSSRGVAGCASILGKARTVTYKWGGPLLRRSGKSCFYDDIAVGIAQGARAAQAGSALAVPPRTDVLSVNVVSADGVPQVDLVDPAGVTIALDGPNVDAASSSIAHATSIEVTSPAAGRWTVVPRPGSPAPTTVEASVPAAAPVVRGRISKPRKGRRTVTYTVRGNSNAKVSLVERTRNGDVPLKGSGRGGKVGFRPNPLVAGRHQIVARISGGDGFVLQEKVLARFKQPAPRGPAAPRSVRVSRGGSHVLVTVTRGRGPASRLVVTARYGEGGRASAVIPAGKRTARLPAPAKSLNAPGPVRVRVQAINAAGVRGAARTGTLRVRAGQQPPRKKRR